MSNSENNKSDDDILRAGDIVPPFDEPAEKPKPQKDDSSGTRVIPIKAAAAKETKPAEQAAMPRFDLAEQIMSEQRRVTAMKRKGPANKQKPITNQEPKVKPAIPIVEKRRPMPAESDPIVAEIVARDIQKWVRSNI